ncbi:MAG: PAS domain S-box protein [Armatimonas sp.]
MSTIEATLLPESGLPDSGFVTSANPLQAPLDALTRRAREQAALFEFTDRLHHARELPEIYEAALDSILNALDCDRASILLFDEAGVMQFVAWRGLSDAYREAASGHSPWQQSEFDPRPFGIEDVIQAELDPTLKSVIIQEGIRALGFIPLVTGGRLIGKFMVYYDIPHTFGDEELALALTIGRQIAFGVERERVEANCRLQEAGQALLAAIVSSSGDAIVSKDLNGIVTSWNAAAEAIYGWKAEEIIGRSKALVIPPDLPNELTSILERVRSGKPIEHYETRRVRKDGTYIDVEISVSPVRDGQGRIMGAATIVRDVSERLRTERELKQRQAEVEALNVRLKRSMQETHHRVKNNLQIISAMVDMQTIEHLHEGAIPVKEFERLNTHIRTLALMHDLLTKSVRENEEEQRVSSREALGRLLGLLEKISGNRLLQADVEDVELLSKQVVTLSLALNELVSNAVKHAAGDVEVRFLVQGPVAELSVYDDGPGFPAGFDPMTAAHTGLELVLGLVDSDLKGTVEFENRTGGGACVHVRFPLPDKEET